MEILEILSGMPWWIIALVVTACGLLWRAGRWTGRVDTRLDSLESKLGALESKLDALAKELRGKLDKLLERSPPQDTAAALSPLRLTNLGESISASLGVSRWAAEKAETLVVQVRSGENSEYDIQELCFEYVRNDSNFDLAMRNAMKAQAYENGLEIDQVRRVFGIELRDAVLVLMASATQLRLQRLTHVVANLEAVDSAWRTAMDDFCLLRPCKRLGDEFARSLWLAAFASRVLVGGQRARAERGHQCCPQYWGVVGWRNCTVRRVQVGNFCDM